MNDFPIPTSARSAMEAAVNYKNSSAGKQEIALGEIAKHTESLHELMRIADAAQQQAELAKREAEDAKKSARRATFFSISSLIVGIGSLLVAIITLIINR